MICKHTFVAKNKKPLSISGQSYLTSAEQGSRLKLKPY
ncbi:hypothetical protein W04_1978 [Pseudoalteromonas sp. SW0106-04]|nr:hypothetical protein W04_1978 [Pseudoalteromonas sp. SW0106-04]